MNNLPSVQPAPTRVRYRVVSMAVLLAMVTYLDRSCISVLAPDIMRDLSLTKEQMSYVFSAFAVAYAFFEIPTAWWADKIGARSVLTRIVTWWSIFTIATAVACNWTLLMVTRFLFGIGEAGAWPSVARVFSRWVPRRERGSVQGVFFSGAHLAAGITPLLVIFLSQWLNWRMIFVLFGSIGFVWAVVWHRWFRDDPAEHREVNAAELEYIEKDRPPEAGHSAGWAYWRKLAGHRNIWALCLMYFPNSFAFYFCLTWMPTYLKERFDYSGIMLAILAGLPFFLSVAGTLLGGFATDWATTRFGLRAGRCGVGAAAYVMAAGTMLLAAVCSWPIVSAVSMALASAASMFTLGAAWGTCIDVGGKHSGVVSAAMNTSGQIGSIISPLVVIALKESFTDWSAPLYLICGLFIAGGIAWIFVDPQKRIFD